MRRRIIPYQPYLKEIANQLRKNMTLSEVLLWKAIKNKQMLGFDFDRQKPLSNYIVDFYCKDLCLVIEIDGSSHDDKYALDLLRQKELEELGLHFLRFDDLQVKKDILNVLGSIESWILENKKDG